MNNELSPSRQALNTIQASGADFVLQNRKLEIGTTGNYSPSIDYLLTDSIVYQRSQVYEPNRFVVTGTLPAAVGDALSFKLSDLSQVGEALGAKSVTIEVRRQASPDSLQLMLARAAAMINDLAAVNQYPGVAATSDATTIVITGDLIAISAVESCSVAKTNKVIALNGTPATAIAGTTTVTVTTLAAHGLATGNVINITGATGCVFTNVDQDNAVTSGEIQCTITVTSATEFTLRGVTKSGTNTGTAVLTVVPSQEIGQGDDLSNLRDFVSTVIPSDSNTYTTLTINWGAKMSSLNTVKRNQTATHIVYLNEGSANLDAALAKVREIQNAYTSGGTDSNPEAISVGN